MRTFLVTRRLIQLDSDPRVWLHSAVNHDFLREPQADAPVSPCLAKEALAAWEGDRLARTLGSPTLTCDPSPGCSFLSTTTPWSNSSSSSTSYFIAAVVSICLLDGRRHAESKAHLAIRQECRGLRMVRTAQRVEQTRIAQILVHGEEEATQVPAGRDRRPSSI